MMLHLSLHARVTFLPMPHLHDLNLVSWHDFQNRSEKSYYSKMSLSAVDISKDLDTTTRQGPMTHHKENNAQNDYFCLYELCSLNF